MTTNELYAYYTDKNEAMEIFGDPEEQYEKMALEYEIQRVLLKVREYRKIQKEQFADLCHECFGKDFGKSVDVSRYIEKNKLGYKYDLIAGELTIKKAQHQWVLNGGIAPKYYGILCEVLGLADQNTDSKAESFASYRDLKRRQSN